METSQEHKYSKIVITTTKKLYVLVSTKHSSKALLNCGQKKHIMTKQQNSQSNMQRKTTQLANHNKAIQ